MFKTMYTITWYIEWNKGMYLADDTGFYNISNTSIYMMFKTMYWYIVLVEWNKGMHLADDTHA